MGCRSQSVRNQGSALARPKKKPGAPPRRTRQGQARRLRPGSRQGKGAQGLPRNAADPAVRGKSRPDVRHGPDRRLLPPLYPPGSRGGRHADGDQGRRPGHHRLPRPRPYAGLRHGPEGRDGGTDRAAPRLLEGQGRLDAHVQRRPQFLRRPPARGGPGLARHRLAFANRYRKNDHVSLTYFGDGAANQGQVYESFNMAQLWKLPVVYIIENNRYAMGTAVNRATAQTDFSKRGASFDIPGEQVDGMDVRAVKAAGDRAVKWCREGNGPYILEMKTYRYRGHSMSDPAKYRTREEVEKVRTEHDPIDQVRARMLASKRASEEILKAVDAEIRKIVNEAAEFATHDPEPDPAELWTDITR